VPKDRIGRTKLSSVFVVVSAFAGTAAAMASCSGEAGTEIKLEPDGAICLDDTCVGDESLDGELGDHSLPDSDFGDGFPGDMELGDSVVNEGGFTDGLFRDAPLFDAPSSDGSFLDAPRLDASHDASHDGPHDGSLGDEGILGDGSSGDAYAQREHSTPERHHAIALASGERATIPFAWRSSPGLAPPADLWVTFDGKPLLQVASLGDRPFARAGLDLLPIDPGVPYELVLTRGGDSLSVALVRANATVLRADAQVPQVARARLAGESEAAAIADVVLPSTVWRSSIVPDFGVSQPL
jgi:hypothetical protein